MRSEPENRSKKANDVPNPIYTLKRRMVRKDGRTTWTLSTWILSHEVEGWATTPQTGVPLDSNFRWVCITTRDIDLESFQKRRTAGWRHEKRVGGFRCVEATPAERIWSKSWKKCGAFLESCNWEHIHGQNWGVCRTRAVKESSQMATGRRVRYRSPSHSMFTDVQICGAPTTVRIRLQSLQMDDEWSV